jgi:hypothetical protein
MRNLMNKLANVFVKPLLRSPLHFLVSGSVLLITFTGRKSGKIYSTPVQYRRSGDVVTFFTSKERAWWKNLPGTEVTVRLSGYDYHTCPEVTANAPDFILSEMKMMYPRMSDELRQTLAPGLVMVKLRLAG